MLIVWILLIVIRDYNNVKIKFCKEQNSYTESTYHKIWVSASTRSGLTGERSGQRVERTTLKEGGQKVEVMSKSTCDTKDGVKLEDVSRSSLNDTIYVTFIKKTEQNFLLKKSGVRNNYSTNPYLKIKLTLKKSLQTSVIS